jgi:hypothetical protein
METVESNSRQHTASGPAKQKRRSLGDRRPSQKELIKSRIDQSREKRREERRERTGQATRRREKKEKGKKGITKEPTVHQY